MEYKYISLDQGFAFEVAIGCLCLHFFYSVGCMRGAHPHDLQLVCMSMVDVIFKGMCMLKDIFVEYVLI